MSEFDALDPGRIRQLFDLRSEVYTERGGGFDEDPYPALHRLRESGPVHEGTVHKLVGCDGEPWFQGLPYPNRPHFSVFSFDGCDAVFRDEAVFASSPARPREGDGVVPGVSILVMNGSEHRRYRRLVQPSFVPNRARWWIERWIEATVHALLDRICDDGRADLNTDFCAPIPLLTITGSFGVSIRDALDIRAAVTSGGQAGALGPLYDLLSPIIASRREEAADDLISVLVHAEVTEEDGTRHRLSDDEVFAFSFLLLAAGSGTTWKQLGITLFALLQSPSVLRALRDDPDHIRTAVEESLRWTPTDPMFARFTTQDTELCGVEIPEGSVVHACLAAANRDPARWSDPDAYDPGRPLIPHLGFGSGAHVCLGMHVARAEMVTAITALLERLPNLRLDPDAEAPRIIGMYERGPTALPVLFG